MSFQERKIELYFLLSSIHANHSNDLCKCSLYVAVSISIDDKSSLIYFVYRRMCSSMIYIKVFNFITKIIFIITRKTRILRLVYLKNLLIFN